MEDPVVINKIARFYAPAKTLKDGYRRSKIKAKKASATKSTATTEAELFSRISKYSNTALPAQHADFQNACATLLDPLMNEAREKPYDELAASVLDALSDLIDGSMDATGSADRLPGISAQFKRSPVRIINVESGNDKIRRDDFPQRLAIAMEASGAETSLIPLDGSKVTCLADISAALSHDDALEIIESENNPVRDPLKALKDFLGRIHCKNVFRTTGKLVSPYTEADCQQAHSSVVFVLREAELLPADLIKTFLGILFQSGAPTAVVSCFQFLWSAPDYRDCVFTTAASRDITVDTMASQAATNALRFVKDQTANHFLLGPKVIAVLLNEMADVNGSVQHMDTALKICCMHFYGQYHVSLDKVNKLDPSSEAAGKLFDRLRSLKSCRKFVTDQQPDVRILLLLDCKYFHKFLKMELLRRDKIRIATLTLFDVAVELLSSVGDVPWWEVYVRIVGRQSWTESVKLQHISSDLGDPFVQSLQKCRGILKAMPDELENLSNIWTGLLDKYETTNHADSMDVLLRWQQKSRKGSPLVMLLDDLCRELPTYLNVIFHETMVFDDADLVRERLCCDLRNNTESVLQDPRSLFTASPAFMKDFVQPNLSLVRCSLLTERRSLSLLKSMTAFQKSRSATTEDDPMTDDGSNYSDVARAEFMSCLPGLQALGILSLEKKGQKCSYSIV